MKHSNETESNQNDAAELQAIAKCGRSYGGGRSKRPDRKALQLCAQVRYALEYAINSALKGERGVTVLDVTPAPNTSHLLILVQSLEELSFESIAQLQGDLVKHTNMLRSAVAHSINRKKTPGLSFQVVPRRDG